MTELNEVPPYDDDFLTFCWLNLAPQSRIKVLQHEPKTVWLFGAGASHDYDSNGYGVKVPLASGFFSAFNQLPTSQGFSAHVGPFISYLESSRGIPPDRVGDWDENIETFMTSVESEIEGLKSRHDSADAALFAAGLSAAAVYTNMHFIFASVLNEASNGAAGSLYDYALHFAGANDCFLTFNWDTLLDRALTSTGGWHPNNGYGVTFTACLDSEWKHSVSGSVQFETSWRVLKLHGSTNWLVPYSGIHFNSLEHQSIVPEQKGIFLYWQSTLPYATHANRWRGGYAATCYGYYPPNLPSEYFTAASISAKPGHTFVSMRPRLFSPDDEGSASGIPSSPLLVTPVRQKRYDEYQSTISEVWLQATAALSDATRIVVIGYSFPETDLKPLALIRDTLRMRGSELTLEVVSPGVDVILDRIGREHLAKARCVKPLDGTFADFIAAQAERVPQLILNAAKRDEELAQWLKRLYVISHSRRP